MKKMISVLLAVLMILSVTVTAYAEEAQASEPSFMTREALYVHAVSGSDDTEAWHMWQTIHDEDFFAPNEPEKYFFLPSSADKSSVEIYNGFNRDVLIDGKTLPSHTSMNFEYQPGTVYDVEVYSLPYTLEFMNSNAEAAIFANNSDADGEGNGLMQYLYQDKSLSAKAAGAIVTPDGEIDSTSIKKIKGRGNTTWWKPKRPFNITYDSKVSIAGMAKSKKYSLLANYQDDSLSRNRILYDLSDAVGMPYASDSRFVDFYSNGVYMGSYQMTEKIEVGKDSLVGDFEEDDYLDADGNVKADFPFLCEVDAGATEGDDYFVQISNGQKITIKAPELDENDAGYEKVKKYVREKFEAFYNACNGRKTDLSGYADVNSLASIYLINELGKNWDSGVSSLYFTYKADENGDYKFYASPVWDYDNSIGNAVGVEKDLKNMGVTDYEEYTGWWCKFKGKSKNQKSSTNIINRLSQNSGVLELAKGLWFEKFVPAIEHFEGKVFNEEIDKDFYTAEKYYSLIKDSAEMNYKSGWLLNTGAWIADHSKLTPAEYNKEANTYTTYKKAFKYENTFEGMYNYCRDWLLFRTAWLSKEMASEKPAEIELDEKITQPETVPATTEAETETTEAETETQTSTEVITDTTEAQTVPETTDAPTESATEAYESLTTPETTAEITETKAEETTAPEEETTAPETTVTAEPTESGTVPSTTDTTAQPTTALKTQEVKTGYQSNFILDLTGTKFVYSGKTITPLVSFKTPDGIPLHSSFLDISYSKGRKEVGTYKVTVSVKGVPMTAKTAEFTIVPRSVKISKVKRASSNKTAKIKWKKSSHSITGYQVVYSKNKSFKKQTKKTVKAKSSLTIKKLKKTKNYYVKIRAYKTVGGKNYYSDWSKAKKISVVKKK